MRTAKLTAPKQFEVVHKNVQFDSAAGEAVVQVKAVGICGTDIHVFQGQRGDITYPLVMGHELSGTIVQLGENVSHLKVGDRVVLDPVFSCGHCSVCLSGHSNVCSSVKCFGVQMDGGFQDFIKVPADQLYVFPENYSFEEAALAEPYSIAANILDRLSPRTGENMLLMGAGTIGLVVLQAAKAIGCRVLVTDIVDAKLENARMFGADCVVNGTSTDLKEAIAAFAPEGVTLLVDAVGIASLLQQCVQLAAPTGKIAVIGFDDTSATIAPAQITRRELTLVGSRMNNHQFPKVMDWFAFGQVHPEKMITACYPLEEIQAAFEHTLYHNAQCIKTIITL